MLTTDIHRDFSPFHIICFQRSLQPELLAKMPALYESLAEALSGVRAQDAGFQKAQAQAGHVGTTSGHDDTAI